MTFYIVLSSVISKLAAKSGIKNVFITHKHFEIPKFITAKWGAYDTFDDAENYMLTTMRQSISDFISKLAQPLSASQKRGTEYYMYDISNMYSIVQATHSDDLFFDGIEYIKIIKCYQNDPTKINAIIDKVKLLL